MKLEKVWTSPSFFVLLLAIVGLLSLIGNPVEFHDENYWDHHGFFFLITVTFFPRLTLLFSSVPFGGLFWWIGFFFAPRVLVAVLATIHFWHQNPLLVFISWVVALSGETSEKKVITTQYTTRTRTDRVVIEDDGVIEADYEVKN
jgi:hypothetical protein